MESYLFFTVESDVDQGKIHHFKIKLHTKYAVDSRNGIKVIKEDYEPKIGDKLYFLPGVNIPRVKVKDLILNYNISVVRNIKDANVIFGGNNSEAKMVDTGWFYSLKTEDFKECFEALKPHLDQYDINSIETALEFYKHEHIFTNWVAINEITDNSLECYKSYVQNPGAVAMSSRGSKYLNIILEDYEEIMDYAVSRKVFHESGLIDKLNSDDAILIDSTVFEQLDNMFQSSDADNHVIAMEIMANSKYKESLLYIHMLFKEHYHKINNSGTKNHVNFKSLLSYLNKTRHTLSSSLDTIIHDLQYRGVLDVNSLNILLSKYHSEIINAGNTNYFKVKEITVSEELLQELNHNYVYNIIPDFTPVEIENSKDTGASNVIAPESLTWT